MDKAKTLFTAVQQVKKYFDATTTVPPFGVAIVLLRRRVNPATAAATGKPAMATDDPVNAIPNPITFADFIASGAFANSTASDMSVTPYMTPLQLEEWALRSLYAQHPLAVALQPLFAVQGVSGGMPLCSVCDRYLNAV